MTNDVVIAHYKERLSSWVHLLPEANVIVYTKGKPEKFQPHPKVNEVIPLPNVGRESHTYLTHIVKNYPHFPAVTLFLQGNPRRHGYKFNFEKYFSIELGKCSSVMKLASRVSTKLYANFDKGLEHKARWKKTERSSYSFVEWWREHISVSIPSTNTFKVSWGACFSVTSEYILAHPIEYYQKLLASVSYSVDPEEGHFMERAWFTIFYDSTNE